MIVDCRLKIHSKGYGVRQWNGGRFYFSLIWQGEFTCKPADDDQLTEPGQRRFRLGCRTAPYNLQYGIARSRCDHPSTVLQNAVERGTSLNT